MSEKSYALVMLDFDGTVVDSGKAIVTAMDKAFEINGMARQSEEVYRKFIGPPPFVLLTEEFGCAEEKAWEITHSYRKIFREGIWRQIAPYPGMVALLEALQSRGMKLAIATTRPQDTTDMLLDHLRLRRFFGHIAANNGDSVNEDKLRQVREVLAADALPGDAACMVGDRRFDMKAAMDAGIDGIFAAYGYGSAAEVAPYAPVFAAEDVGALRAYLLGEEA